MSDFGGSYGGGRGRQDAGRGQRVGSDRFGNPSIVKRLKCPRNGEPGSVSGLHVGHVEIGGSLYEITVTGCKQAKDDRHSGWVRVTKKQARRNGSF